VTHGVTTRSETGERVLAILRAHEAELRAAGIRRLSLFGSVARGDDEAESDVDLAAELDPEARIGLFALAALERRKRLRRGGYGCRSLAATTGQTWRFARPCGGSRFCRKPPHGPNALSGHAARRRMTPIMPRPRARSAAEAGSGTPTPSGSRNKAD
jgi:predicted nucleotidyltransferase